MPKTLQAESDPFFTLLTDALRAGPGSPEWHQAVSKLRAEGHTGSSEYKLLCSAREHLETGKDFRAVRAGPGFTRRLLTRLDEEPGAGAGVPTANVIMVLSAGAILGVLGLVGFFLSRGGGERPAEPGPDLAAMYFPNDAAAATFERAVPPEWQTIGQLPLTTDGALRPAIVPMEAGDYVGGGVVLAKPLPPGEPFAVEAVVTVPETGGDFIAEVFVSDGNNFDEHRATSPNELVWLLQGADQKVMVRGRNEGRVETLRQFDRPLTVRIVLDGPRALVESRRADGPTAEAGGAGAPSPGPQDAKLWTGPHGLATDKPLYAGVRFIRGAGASPEVASVRSLRVLTRGK